MSPAFWIAIAFMAVVCVFLLLLLPALMYCTAMGGLCGTAAIKGQ
jgi:hypothetical protein